jgi:hypothetical protein
MNHCTTTSVCRNHSNRKAAWSADGISVEVGRLVVSVVGMQSSASLGSIRCASTLHVSPLVRHEIARGRL